MAGSANTNNKDNGSEFSQHQLNESLGFLVNVVARSMRVALEDKLKEYNVTSTQWVVMQGINELGEARQTDVGKKVALDDATITRQMDKLEKIGLIKRTPAVDDRRTQMVKLTPKGKKQLPLLNDEANEINEIATKGVRRSKTRSIYLDLIRVRDNLSNNGST
jgi:MarR family transcriptional regulator, transcriptional regulator for hemolysin